MARSFAAVVLVSLPLTASAQVGAPVGPLMIGGREVAGPPIGSAASALYPVQTPVLSPFTVGGGSLGAPSQVYVPSGAWGGVNYPPPAYPVAIPSAPVVRSRTVVLSGEGTATLTVQLPTSAQLWVSRQKVVGEPTSEWTLTSPVLQAGQSHTFVLKSRWSSGGKAYEADRSVTVAVGDRSRLIVVSGSELKE